MNIGTFKHQHYSYGHSYGQCLNVPIFELCTLAIFKHRQLMLEWALPMHMYDYTLPQFGTMLKRYVYVKLFLKPVRLSREGAHTLCTTPYRRERFCDEVQ